MTSPRNKRSGPRCVRACFNMQPLKKLPPPKQWWRKVPFRVVSDRKFDRIIMAAICASVLVMSAGWHGEPTEWTEMKDNFNLGFTCVFIAEAALKIIAIGFVEYWSSSWNRFDLWCAAAWWTCVCRTCQPPSRSSSDFSGYRACSGS